MNRSKSDRNGRSSIRAKPGTMLWKPQPPRNASKTLQATFLEPRSKPTLLHKTASTRNQDIGQDNAYASLTHLAIENERLRAQVVSYKTRMNQYKNRCIGMKATALVRCTSKSRER